ncbi:MAG TPA: glutamine amidotransferase [Chloroflexia bacterium]|nr:glutamine amidotransferase [Chloroflexia bacterium]
MKLEIVFLYNDLMNIYGDRGNIITFARRCQWRGIEVTVSNLSIGDKLDPDRYDFYFFGGGQDKEQYAVADDLKGEKGRLLAEAANNGAVILSVCGGYQLLGHYYRPDNGPELPGIGILDSYTVAGSKRLIGNVIIESEFGELVAFENHSGKTYLGPKARPLGRSVVGYGNNAEDGMEGAIQNNVFGCYLHGSLLPKNPHFTDHLIKLALARRYGKIELEPLDDTVEWAAHKAALQRARDTR